MKCWPLCCWWLIWPMQNDAKHLKNDKKTCTRVLIWEYRWTWIWRTTVRRIFAYDGWCAWSQSNAYQVFVICIWQILHMTDQFSWSHWVCHIQVHLYSVKAFQWIPTWHGLDGFQKSPRHCAWKKVASALEELRFIRSGQSDKSNLRISWFDKTNHTNTNMQCQWWK